VHEKLVREVEFLTDGSDEIRLICATINVAGSSFKFILVVWTKYRQTFKFQGLWFHVIADNCPYVKLKICKIYCIKTGMA